MKKLLLIIISIGIGLLYAKAQCNSSDGYGINPVGTYRTLNIFINIIYDQNPTANPMADNNPDWPSTNVEGVMTSGPTYFEDYINTSLTTAQDVHGLMTRIYYESSFGQLILLGDMLVVNIKQSTIRPYGGSFDSGDLINSCLTLINVAGVNTLYGHNSISDYDMDSDGCVDFVQYFCRNGTDIYGLTYPNGGFTSWGGKIRMDGILKDIDNYSFQKAVDNISKNYKHLSIHEFAHNLLGSNAFHTSGGNHYTWPGSACTFMGLQGGWGLMGAANSSLVSCNAYERWRLNWTSNIYNPDGITIQASTENSDIDNTSGHKTFYLRDFVSTGDAVRIRLPYNDSPSSSNQYIWIENHQIGINNKIDFFYHSNNNPCIPFGTPGVYAYYQVGKDNLSGSSGMVWPSNETDNLKVISAEGNWDMIFDGNQYDCAGLGNRTVVKYVSENPLSGYNDQMKIFYNSATDYMTGKVDDFYPLVKKYENNTVNSSLPALGDDADVFTNYTKIGISTNPSSANTVTYHVNQNGGTINPSSSVLDTRKVYLTGLQISFSIDGSDQFGDIYKVDIDWDKYNIENNLRWTGSIVLNESAILKTGRTILFNQNKTPNQMSRSVSTGEFAESTFFTCKNGSFFTMESKSKVIVDENSTFTLQSGSTLEIEDGAEFIVTNNSRLEVESGATIIIKGSGRLSVKCDGQLCVNSGATLNLQDFTSCIFYDQGALASGCLSDLSSVIMGPGFAGINGYGITVDNTSISTDKYYAGYNISSSNTTIQGTGTEVVFDAINEVLINSSFEVGLGATFETRTTSVGCGTE